MNFTYAELRKMSTRGERVGQWNGLNVYAASAAELEEYGNGAYLILYDDDNVLVRKDSRGRWHSYGWVSSTGSVHEYSAPRCYREEVVAVEKKTEEVKEVKEEEIIADVQIGIDVNKTLKAARELTVESLLEGFNYGLD